MSFLEILPIFIGLILAYIALTVISSYLSSFKSSRPRKPIQPLSIPPEVERLARENKKIQAIKLLRDTYPSLGLAQAKEQVEAFISNQFQLISPLGPQKTVQESPESSKAPYFSIEAQQLSMDPNQKIMAIKILRQENPGMGLAEAKQAVEAYYETNGGR